MLKKTNVSGSGLLTCLWTWMDILFPVETLISDKSGVMTVRATFSVISASLLHKDAVQSVRALSSRACISDSSTAL